ncbi:MAG: choice-of-anchor tandem repeat GloVer-containing protein [Candidatus Cybelea sp.]
MRRWNLIRYAISSCVIAALLAGCGGSQPPIVAPSVIPQTSAIAPARNGAHYRVVHRFSHTRDGGRPAGSLLDVNGTLYGTTQFGGGDACPIDGGTGCGTVYRLNPTSGKKKVLYSFRGGSSDGASPNGDLIDVNGTLYGTTAYGGGTGGYGPGTVYSISLTGTETMLHSFGGGSDGTNPFSGLIDVNGTLYGTTGLSNVSGCPFLWDGLQHYHKRLGEGPVHFP